MDAGQEVTIWLARASAASYLVAVMLLWSRSKTHARLAWTIGLLLYLLHVFGAFHYFYDWSHSIAYRETARQTNELFGVNWGGGLYLNYLFTLVWVADCAWWWRSPIGYASRSRAISRSVHGFLAFMFVNATVVVWVLRARSPH